MPDQRNAHPASTATPLAGPARQPHPISDMTYRWRVWEYLIRCWRPYFWTNLAQDVGAPLLYLLALGLGMGTLINRNGAGALGVPYIDFIAPALLTGAAVQVAVGELTFPLFARLVWVRTMWGITATPVTPALAADAHVMFVGTRVLASSLLYFSVLLCFGMAGGATGVLIIPIALLCALSCAVWIMLLTARLKDDGPKAFNILIRFGVLPMTLFSASFFPITQLPWTVRWLAFFSPLWHGNELARAAALGGLGRPVMALHLAVLLILAMVGFGFARREFGRRLVV